MSASIVAEIVLPIVSQPEGGTPVPLMRKTTRDPYFMGGGYEDLLCGNCQAILAKAVCRHRLPHAVLHCPECGNYVELNGKPTGGTITAKSSPQLKPTNIRINYIPNIEPLKENG